MKISAQWRWQYLGGESNVAAMSAKAKLTWQLWRTMAISAKRRIGWQWLSAMWPVKAWRQYQ